jgi:hypothetical protein
MKELTGPTPEITDQRDAFDALEGYPRKAEHIGAALAPFVPDEYSPGAIGWTAHAFNVNELTDDETGELTGQAVIYVPDDLAAEHDGKTVELPDGRFVTIDLSGAIDVQTESSRGEAFTMHQFTGFGGVPVHVRSVRVALVMDALGGAQLIFPTGEDPLTVAETFDEVVTALAPELVGGLVRLTGEDGDVAVLHVHSLLGGGTRVAISGARTLDVTEGVTDVLMALGR